MGKVSFRAVGIRKTKAKLSGLLEPLNYLQIQLEKTKQGYTIVGARLLADYQDLIVYVGQGLSSIYKLLNKMLQEEQPQPQVWRNLQQFMVLAKHNPPKIPLAKCWFYQSVLNSQGWQGKLVAPLDPSNIIYFDFADGKLTSDMSKQCQAVEVNTIKLWKYLASVEASIALNINAPLTTIVALDELLLKFLSWNIGQGSI